MSPTQFDATSTTDDVIAGIDLRGKTALITGTSSGLGSETARALAQAGATVIMAARDAQKNARACDAIRAANPAAKLNPITLDLGNLASVRRAAAETLAAFPRIDMLINNAGIMACPLAHTADGFEMQFGTNHLGHFLLTCLLMPALQGADNARIVSLSSGAHRICPVDFDDPHFERRPYDSWLAYGQAKTANALFAVGLTQRLQAFGITANAVHPGTVPTDVSRHLTDADKLALFEEWQKQGMTIEFKSLEQGAATQVWAAVSPQLDAISGRYLEDCRIGILDEAPAQMAGHTAYALDPEAAERLWNLSEQCVGQSFVF